MGEDGPDYCSSVACKTRSDLGMEVVVTEVACRKGILAQACAVDCSSIDDIGGYPGPSWKGSGQLVPGSPDLFVSENIQNCHSQARGLEWDMNSWEGMEQKAQEEHVVVTWASAEICSALRQGRFEERSRRDAASRNDPSLHEYLLDSHGCCHDHVARDLLYLGHAWIGGFCLHVGVPYCSIRLFVLAFRAPYAFDSSVGFLGLQPSSQGSGYRDSESWGSLVDDHAVDNSVACLDHSG